MLLIGYDLPSAHVIFVIKLCPQEAQEISFNVRNGKMDRKIDKLQIVYIYKMVDFIGKT